MKDQIKQLEDDIQADAETIKVKKAMLSALKKEESKNIPFSKTKLGGAWYGTIRAITSPFAGLHKSAQDNLEHPFVVQAEKYAKRADKLLRKSVKLSRKDKEKQSTMMAVIIAEFVMDFERFLNKHKMFEKELGETLQDLHREISRLRPPKDEQKFEEVKEMITQLTSQEA